MTSPEQYSVIVPAPEFDLGLCVSCGQMFRWTEVGERTWAGHDGDAWYWVRQSQHAVDVWSNRPESAFRQLFDLDANVELWGDSSMWRQGLRTVRTESVVETLFSFICTANNHLKRIVPMVQRLGTYGQSLGQFKGADFWAFPSPETIAEIEEGDLRRQGFGYRAKSIVQSARVVTERGGVAWLESLRQASYSEAFQGLVSLPGVGPKLADCVCLFGLGHRQAVPVDTHLWHVATRTAFPEWEGASLTTARYRAVGDWYRDRYGDQAGVVHHHLFVDELENWRSRR